MGAPPLTEAREVLSRAFGYSAFRPGQAAAVLSVLRRRDTVVILPTGGGKSLCYQVPALMLPGLTVVVSPLISLMRDQVRSLRVKGVAAAFINSALTSNEANDVLVRAERGELKLLYVAPERFELSDVAVRLNRSRVSLLAVDEAHCISHWGHDFRPSYRRLTDVRRRLGWPPAIGLTATATPEVRSDIISQLRLDRPAVIVTGFDRPNLRYSVIEARTDALKAPLIQRAIAGAGGSSIVYASTKRSVDRVVAALNAAGLRIGAYHAGLDTARRKRIQDSFMSGDLRAIVATNAFGMGIDKPDVRLVLHHSMPGTLEAYYQEAGRAGRDGKESRVILLHSYADRYTHEFFIGTAHPPRPAVEATYIGLQRQAGADGVFRADLSTLATPRGAKATARQAENAIRILERSGAVEILESDPSRVSVRLIASVNRINSELASGSEIEIGLLRALWTAVGEKLVTGAKLDLAGLPPGLNGPAVSVPLLDALQARQFIHWRRLGGGIRLRHPRAPLDYFRIDWKELEARRLGELEKLDTMQHYAFAKSCRRAFFLRYFGETARGRRCASCDNCTGGRGA